MLFKSLDAENKTAEENRYNRYQILLQTGDDPTPGCGDGI